MCSEREIRLRDEELFKTVILGVTLDSQGDSPMQKACVCEGCFRICASFSKKEEAIKEGISKALSVLPTDKVNNYGEQTPEEMHQSRLASAGENVTTPARPICAQNMPQTTPLRKRRHSSQPLCRKRLCGNASMKVANAYIIISYIAIIYCMHAWLYN